MSGDGLVREWLAALPDVHARLAAGDPVRVADLGCGAGWSAIALAQAFAQVRVDGFDPDEASIGDARRNAAEEDVADRVRFEVADAVKLLPTTGDYDLVRAFDVVARLPHPVEALRTMRGLCRPSGTVLLIERHPSDHLHLSPDGDGRRPGYAHEAGFTAVVSLPIDDARYGFFRLTP